MQLQVFSQQNPFCPYRGRLDPWDRHCFSFNAGQGGYEFIGEDHEEHDAWLSSIGGVGLEGVAGHALGNIDLPGFLPIAHTKGAKNIFAGYTPRYLGVHLAQVVTSRGLLVRDNLYDLMRLPRDTRVVLLTYGKDALIERMWPQRAAIFEQLKALNLYLVTGINFSSWDDHPHAERLINIKRGLLTYSEMLKFGLPAIPHLQWYSSRDLQEWLAWLRSNDVNLLAVNMQTLRRTLDWSRAIAELADFRGRLPRPTRFLVTGASSFQRMAIAKEALGDVVFSNGYALKRASLGMGLGKGLWLRGRGFSISEIAHMNVQEYEVFVRNLK